MYWPLPGANQTSKEVHHAGIESLARTPTANVRNGLRLESHPVSKALQVIQRINQANMFSHVSLPATTHLSHVSYLCHHMSMDWPFPCANQTSKEVHHVSSLVRYSGSPWIRHPPKLLPRGVTWELAPQVISICSICWCVEHEDHPQNWVYYGGFTMKVIIGFSYDWLYHIWVVFILVLNLGNFWEWAELLIAMVWIPYVEHQGSWTQPMDWLDNFHRKARSEWENRWFPASIFPTKTNPLNQCLFVRWRLLFFNATAQDAGDVSPIRPTHTWKSRDTPTKTCLLSLTQCYQSCRDDVALSENRLPQNLMVYHHFANSNSHLVVSSKFTVRKWSTFIIILLEGDHQKFNRRT